MTTTRKRRGRNVPHAVDRIYARVDQHAKEKLDSVADITGISAALVLERILLELELDVHGLPHGWAEDYLTAEQGELPVDDS